MLFRSINLHDVPYDRFPPDLDHGFWLRIGFFAYTSSQTARKYYAFHASVHFHGLGRLFSQKIAFVSKIKQPTYLGKLEKPSADGETTVGKSREMFSK